MASGSVGKTGKKISTYLNIHPGTYNDGRIERVAYFRLVGLYSNTGWNMWENLQKALENLKFVSPDNESNENTERLPTEIAKLDEHQLLKEGRVVQVLVNRYERNKDARTECLNHYGYKCFICNFDFGIIYGDFAKDFIHVHHKIPLFKIGNQYTVNPIQDLIPVCPNCHSAIHMEEPSLTIEELKERMKKGAPVLGTF